MEWLRANGGPLAVVIVGLSVAGFRTDYGYVLVAVAITWWVVSSLGTGNALLLYAVGAVTAIASAIVFFQGNGDRPPPADVAIPLAPPAPPSTNPTPADSLTGIPITPFVTLSLKGRGELPAQKIRGIYEGACYTVSFRDRSDSGGHVCQDNLSKRVLDPCYPSSIFNVDSGYYCYLTPWDDADNFFVFVFKDGVREPDPRFDQALAASRGALWGIVLANGYRCIHTFSGTPEQDPSPPHGFFPQSRPLGATYLCSGSISWLDVVGANGWVIGRFRELQKGWHAAFKQDDRSVKLVRIIAGKSGPE